MFGSQGSRVATGPEIRVFGKRLLCGILKMVTGRTFQLLWLQNLEALCESSQLRSTEAESGPRTMQIPLPQEDLSTEALKGCHLWAS